MSEAGGRGRAAVQVEPPIARRQRGSRLSDPALHPARAARAGRLPRPRGDLAEQFGISRPTLREGCSLLSSGNLVRATKGPGGGIFVAHTAEDGISRSLSDAIAMMVETEAVSLEELLDARLLLEVPLAGRAAQRVDPETVERLRAAVRAEAAGPSSAADGVTGPDAEIHQIVAAAADNRMVAALTAWIFDVVQPKLAEVLDEAIVSSAVVEQHEALLAAMEKGDAARAERAMKEHLLYLRDLLRLVDESERDDG